MGILCIAGGICLCKEVLYEKGFGVEESSGALRLPDEHVFRTSMPALVTNMCGASFVTIVTMVHLQLRGF